MKIYKDLAPSPRTIMTPGPVEVDPRVLRAMSYPILGQFDPEFTDLMNETMGMLRQLFMTSNQWAYPVDGTSRSGIEAVLVSLIEPGDKVLVPIYGRFGYLLVEIAKRCGADVVTLEREWGRVFEPDEIIAGIRAHRPALVALVHGETSTGRLQPLDGIGAACRKMDALFVVDAVATIGGVQVATDEWQIDAVMGGTQKCLSVPAGLAPVTYNSRAEAKLLRRKTIERGLLTQEEAAAASLAQGGGGEGVAAAGNIPTLLSPESVDSINSPTLHSPESVDSINSPTLHSTGSIDSINSPPLHSPMSSRSTSSWPPHVPRSIQSNYLDLSQLQDYWSPARLNHHTEATTMLYALREGLRLVLEEGLEERFARHRLHEAALVAGIEAMGLQLFGDPAHKMPVVTCVEIPHGVDGESVRSMLLGEFGIEIASSFGALKGRIWRIGTMGYSCSKRNVLLTLGALEAVLLRHRCKLEAGAALQAAMDVYAAAR